VPALALRQHLMGRRSSALLRPVTSLELQDLGIRCQIGQRRTHGLSAVPQLPPAPPPAQNLPPGAVAPARRRGGRQLGARCGSLVVECEEPATHGRHSRSRLLAEPGAASAPVAERLPRSSRRLSPLHRRRPRALDRDAAPRMPRPTADHRAPPRRDSAAGIRRALQRSPAAPVAASPAARRSRSLTSGADRRPRERTGRRAAQRDRAVDVAEVDGQHRGGLGAQELPPAGVGVPRRSWRIPWCLRIRRIVEAPTRWPTLSSSPWIRR
jgi:hypothetical protein